MAVTSYSQFGEDLQVANLLGRREDLTYVDVGCLWPVELSNTYFFYRRGGRGLCIDPNPDVAAWFRNDRPRDVVVTAAVGLPGTARYVAHENPVFNTASEDRAAEVQRRARARGGRTVRATTPVEVRSLDDVVRESGVAEDLGPTVDLLSVDTTGMDLDVLQGFSFEVLRPTVVVCAHRPSAPGMPADADPLVVRMDDAGYAVAGFGRNALYFHDAR